MEENENQSPQLFKDRSQEIMAQSDAAAVARATQEIQAALIIGKRFPRDEVAAEARILQACRRKGLAEDAEYEYSRGGTRITGPTIDLLRAIANRWGNLLFGWAEVERKGGASMVRCWAWDTQNNSRAERTFTVKHWRDTQGGGYALEDERDIYELLANMASRRVRACLEEIIDSDIVAKAVDQCRKTLREGEKLPIKDRAAKMVLEFLEYGVTQEMIEKRLGNKLDAVSENQVASLRRIYKALRDGVGRREDYFKAPLAEPNMDAGKAPEQPPREPVHQAPTGKPEPKTPSTATEGPPRETPQSEPAAEQTTVRRSFSYLKVVREFCKVTRIPEGILLGFLAETGATNGDVSTLEELNTAYPGVIKSVHDNWPEIAGQIQGARKAGQ